MALADDVKRRKAVFLDFRSSPQIETGTDKFSRFFLSTTHTWTNSNLL